MREFLPMQIRDGTNETLGVEYLKLFFKPLITPKGSEKDSWRLLIIDGHNSHLTSTEFISFCANRQIELFLYFSPHTYYSYTAPFRCPRLGLFGLLLKDHRTT